MRSSNIASCCAIPSLDSALLERYLGRACAGLGVEDANAAWEEGRRTGFEHAIALLCDIAPRGASSG